MLIEDLFTFSNLSTRQLRRHCFNISVYRGLIAGWFLVALQSQFDGQIQHVERTQGLPSFAWIKITRIINKYVQPGGNATDKGMI